MCGKLLRRVNNNQLHNQLRQDKTMRQTNRAITPRGRFLRGTILTITGALAWAFSGSCGQYIFSNSGMEPGALASVRMLGAGLILFVISLLTRRKKTFLVWRHPKDAVRLIAFALAGIMFSQYAYLSAIRYSNSGTATVFQNTGIILVMIVTCLLARRLPRKREGFAVVFTLIGIYLLATGGRPGNLVISPNALTWGLVAAVAVTIYTILPGGLLDRWGTPVINGFAMLMGGTVMALGFRIWEKDWHYSVPVILAILAMVIFGTVVSFSFYLQGVADIGPIKASMLACIEPVATTVISAIWMGTRFTPIDIVGFVLIIGSCLLVSLGGEKEASG